LGLGVLEVSIDVVDGDVDPGLAGVAAVEVFRALLFDEHDAVAVDERGRPSGSPAR
jgi:hypothetical protein